MSAAHIHLVLNHVPVLGAVFAAVVLGVGLLRRDESWQRVALWTLLAVGIASVVVYLTGEPAEELVEGAAGFSHEALGRHEEVALWATWLGGATGAAALVALVRYRAKAFSRAVSVGVLVLALALVGVMGWTANSGGKVSHPELRGEAAGVAEEHSAAQLPEAVSGRTEAVSGRRELVASIFLRSRSRGPSSRSASRTASSQEP